MPFDGSGNFLSSLQEKLDENIIMEIRNKSTGLPDFRVGEKVAKWKPGKGNPEELGSYFEGDILEPPIPSREKVAKWKPGKGNPEELGSYFEGDILEPPIPSRTRNGMSDTRYRWPKGIIPYVITGRFTTTQINMIKSAMNTIQQKTCIKFRTKTSSDYNYVRIENAATGCWSFLGRRGGGNQTLNLQAPACVTSVGTAIHELLHTIGFYHEHSRMDRDSYVTINYNNIEPGSEKNFEKRSSTTYSVTYDHGSVMHYGKNFFSKKGLDTIVTKV
ncbi:hypothetical protein B566_EDAN001839, partial [Ephemera danica]